MTKSSYFFSIILLFIYGTALGGTSPTRVLHVGYMNSLTQLPLIIAYERDHFVYQNVTVVLENYRSPVALEAAFRAGAVDVAYLPLAVNMALRADGVEIGWGDNLHRGGSALLISTERWNKRASEGLGVIGIPGIRSVEFFGLHKSLYQESLEYGIGCTVQVVRSPDAESSLRKGKVTGFAIEEPYLSSVQAAAAIPMIRQEIPEFPYVLIYRPEVLTDDWRIPLAEWLSSVHKACAVLAEDIQNFGGEQTAITQSRYIGFEPGLIRGIFQKNPEVISFAPRKIVSDEIDKVLIEMLELHLLDKPIELGAPTDPLGPKEKVHNGGEK